MQKQIKRGYKQQIICNNRESKGIGNDMDSLRRTDYIPSMRIRGKSALK